MSQYKSFENKPTIWIEDGRGMRDSSGASIEGRMGLIHGVDGQGNLDVEIGRLQPGETEKANRHIVSVQQVMRDRLPPEVQALFDKINNPPPSPLPELGAN